MLSLCIRVSGEIVLPFDIRTFSLADFHSFYESQQVHYNENLISISTICFTKALEVHNLPLTQEFNRFADIGFFNQAEDIVVGGAGFLFCDTFISTNYEGG